MSLDEDSEPRRCPPRSRQAPFLAILGPSIAQKPIARSGMYRATVARTPAFQAPKNDWLWFQQSMRWLQSPNGEFQGPRWAQWGYLLAHCLPNIWTNQQKEQVLELGDSNLT
uniref:Uncharacterized protein n=2 Tax=Eutreptiella gymnastica TaxID=73025 RepID=A0A7S1NSC0_9EUGL